MSSLDKKKMIVSASKPIKDELDFKEFESFF